MNQDHLKELLSTRPFEPLEIQLSSGQTIMVKHPENVLLTKTTLIVADPEKDVSKWCSIGHIVAVQKTAGLAAE